MTFKKKRYIDTFLDTLQICEIYWNVLGRFFFIYLFIFFLHIWMLCDISKSFGTFWDVFRNFGMSWNILGCFVTFWNVLKRFWTFWDILGQWGMLRDNERHFWLFCEVLGGLRMFWDVLKQCGMFLGCFLTCSNVLRRFGRFCEVEECWGTMNDGFGCFCYVLWCLGILSDVLGRFEILRDMFW